MDKLSHLVQRTIAWVGGLDLVVLLGTLAVVGGAWVFLEIADEVTEGDIQDLDERIVRAMRNPNDPADPIGPPWLKEVGRDLTALGGVTVLLLVVAAVAGFLAIERRYHALLLVIAATFGGLSINALLKNLYDRPRPSVVPHLAHVMTASFPSGHSMLSAVVYLTLGALLARLVQHRGLKVYLIAVAMLLTFLVGVSRVYLGVHYPSDVLAGWSAGLVWAVLCWLVVRYLQRRGAVEPAVDAAPT
jgi:undecaprenyl-diphosphatase